jgi:hypothetical protein
MSPASGSLLAMPHGASGSSTPVARTLVATTDYTLTLTIKGTSVSVTVNGSLALSFAFNGAVADGQVGVLSRSGTTSVDAFRVSTNDRDFTNAPRARSAT